MLPVRKAAKDRGFGMKLWPKWNLVEIITVVPYDANRGGLLVEYEKVFADSCQYLVSAGHYPRVDSGDRMKSFATIEQQ